MAMYIINSKFVGKFSITDLFKTIIKHYKTVIKSENIMQQSTCLVINPKIVHTYVFLLNCTVVG